MNFFEELEKDRFRRFLGAEILEVSRGYAKVKGVVKGDYLNFHGTAHGSYITALADFAFAIAGNSDGIKRSAVSIKIDFYRAVYEDDELIAEAKIVHGRKIAFFELKVMRGDDIVAKGEAIAYGRG
jgi:acyl-CoA thioesterase